MEKEYLETETYAIISGINWSIQKINPLIKDSGFQFVGFNLSELERNFSEVFHISREFTPKQSIVKSIDSTGFNSISDQFQDALAQYFCLHPGNEETPPDFEVYLLKKVKHSKTERGKDYILIGQAASDQIEIEKFAKELIRKLRIFKRGIIEFQGYFSIFTVSRQVIQKHKSSKVPSWDVLEIADSDLEPLAVFLSNKLNPPELLHLAVDMFELSYEVLDAKVKFSLMMIALESIFNKSSSDPVKHILARHCSLLLATNKTDFEKRFIQMRRLYDIRCNIVHGSTDAKVIAKLNKNLSDDLNGLEIICREVLNKLYNRYEVRGQPITKERLFDFLNSEGFA